MPPSRLASIHEGHPTPGYRGQTAAKPIQAGPVQWPPRARSSADRAGGFGPSGRGFDSCRARQLKPTMIESTRSADYSKTSVARIVSAAAVNDANDVPSYESTKMARTPWLEVRR